MSQPQISAGRFNQQLALEAQRVLADVIFTRAPTQSRLLRFLVDRAVAGSGPATQYEIAVEGLGKSEDFFEVGDSYPRVQTSRLRRNLENYYARNLPGNGFEIALEPGTYWLKLVRRAPNQDTQSQAREEPAQSGEVSEQTDRGSIVTRIGLAILALLMLLSAPYSLGGKSPPAVVSAPQKPTTALVFEHATSESGDPLPAELVQNTRWIANLQLSNSFVSKPLPAGRPIDQADYTLSFNFGTLGQKTTALFLSVADREGDIIYSNSIPYDPDEPAAFTHEIEASLVVMTSPTGLIAEAEFPAISAAESSDYACFLAIAGRRANGEAAARLADRCIKRFPESEYQSFWLARRSFTTYQRGLFAGEPVAKSGQGWNDLQAALDADPFNAFANVVAAKVELAHGSCEDANVYVNRALERRGSYPALISAVVNRAAACTEGDADRMALIERVLVLSEFNPNPDPFLQLYLIIGLLAADERELAARVARRNAIADPQGAVEETVELLNRSLADEALARENRGRLTRSIALFVWNKQATKTIVEALVDA